MVTVLATSACSSIEGPATVRRDSAGVEIVESRWPAWSSTQIWLVDSTPRVDLTTTGSGAPHEFYRVEDALRLPDGQIVVADRGSAQIRFFDQNGAFLFAFGRRGEGPGEFDRLQTIARWGQDSLIAFDSWLNRTTVLSLTGSLARTIPTYDPDRRFDAVHALNDTVLLALNPIPGIGYEEFGMYRQVYTAERLSPAGQPIDTITTVRGFEGFNVPGGDARPLFRRAGYVVTRESLLYVGEADSLEVRLYRDTGELVRIVRVPGLDLRLSAEEMEAERAGNRALMPAEIPAAIEEVMAALPDRESRPAYDDLLVDSEECIWTRDYRGYAELVSPPSWKVFSPDGAWLGRVPMPVGFTAFQVGSDYVLGKWVDRLDVEHVQVLSLDRKP